MRPANTVATVFKVLVISLFLMIVTSFAASMYTIFSTKQKIDAVGNSMKTELSKNNVLLYESLWASDSGNDYGPFLSQLDAIEEATRGSITNESTGKPNKSYVLVSIEVLDYKDGVAVDSKAKTLMTNTVTSFSSDSKYEKGSSCSSSADYYKALTGKYGEFKVLRFNYAIGYNVFLPNGVNSGDDPNARGDTSLVQSGNSFMQSFDYVVPCLRYMK